MNGNKILEQKDLLLKKAEDFDKNNQLLHASQIYLRILTEFGEPKALVRILNSYKKMGNPKAAANIALNYFNENQADDDIIMYASNFLLTLEMYSEALQILCKIDAKNSPEAYFLIGKANFHLSNFKKARENFIDYLDNGDTAEAVPIAYVSLAETEIKLENLDAAQLYAEQAQQFYKDMPEIDYIFAEIFFLKEMYQHAMEKIRKNLKDNNSTAEDFLLAGRICYEMQDFQNSEKYLLKYLKNSGGDPYIYSILGESCLKNKKPNDAEKYFSRALKLDPSTNIAKEGLKKLKTG